MANVPAISSDDALYGGVDSLVVALDTTALSPVDSIPDSLRDVGLRPPYALYRALFSQARLRYSFSDSVLLNADDSILLNLVQSDTVLQNLSIHTYSDLQPLRSSRSDAAPFGVLMLLMAFFAYTKNRYKNYIEEAYHAFGSLNLTRQFYEENSGYSRIVALLSNLLSVLVFGTLAYIICWKLAGAPSHDVRLFTVCFASVSMLFLFKYITLQSIALILPPVSGIVQFYLFNLRMIFAFLSVLFIPVIGVLTFASDDLAFSALGILVIGLISGVSLGVYRGIVIGKDIILDNKWHFFLYLCIFEIAPVIVVVKFIKIYFFS